MNNLKQLPKSQRRVAAKVLYKNGWGSRVVGEWLGVSKDTVIRSSHEPTPEVLRQFETEFELVIKDMKLEARALVFKRIIDLIPTEKRLDYLVKAGEFLEKKPLIQQNNQFNFHEIGEAISNSRRERGLPE